MQNGKDVISDDDHIGFFVFPVGCAGGGMCITELDVHVCVLQSQMCMRVYYRVCNL